MKAIPRLFLRFVAGPILAMASLVCLHAQVIGPPPALMTLKKMSLEELMNLEVTSVSRHPEKLLQAAAAIQVVTGDDMRRAGVSTIPEALRLADNLTVAQKNPHDWAISARGFNTALSNKLLVLIDGRTVYTPLFSGVFWDVQDYLLEDVDRIEAISGPGGTLWGANAVNGVINIISKNAKDTQGGYLEFGGGTELKSIVGARLGGQLAPGVYYRVYGKYFDRGNSVFSSGREATNDWSMSRGGFRIDSSAMPRSTLTLQGDIYSGAEAVVIGGQSKTSGGNLLGRWSYATGDDSEIRLQVYYDRTHLVIPVAGSAFAPAGILTDDLDTYDVDLQHRFRPLPEHELVWGVGYRFTHDVVANAAALAFLPPTLNHKLVSGFVQDEIKLSKTVTLTLGTKLEHNDYTGREAEPSARLQWNFASDQTLWAAASRAVRTPSRVDRDINQPKPPPAVLAGNATFRSEKVKAYELGYRAQFNAKVSGSLTAFYNEYDDVRSLGFTPVTILPLFFENNLEGETWGFEFNTSYKVMDGWRLHAAYNLLRENIRVKPGKTDLNNALNETADPRYQFSLRSAMDLPGNCELDLAFRQIDSLKINNGGVPATLPRYHELDARFGWRATPEVELMLVGQNLLHAHHPEYGVPSANLEEIKRSFYAKILWRF